MKPEKGKREIKAENGKMKKSNKLERKITFQDTYRSKYTNFKSDNGRNQLNKKIKKSIRIYFVIQGFNLNLSTFNSNFKKIQFLKCFIKLSLAQFF